MPGEPFFKEPTNAKVERKRKRLKLKSVEDQHKAEVRRRDRFCRFPLCSCRTYQLNLEVSHVRHKGIGGNPAGDRSDPALMMYLCSARHRTNRVSVDRGTVWWEPLTEDGANGPVQWKMDPRDLPPHNLGAMLDGLTELVLARERAVNDLEPLDNRQRAVLRLLALMTG